jgi:XTP/dITP diphosphohydrolase
VLPRLILATHNPGKLEELHRLFEDWALELVSVGELGALAPFEDAESFEGNARLKARKASRNFGSVALGDDGGLVVPVLGGAPGVHSSRWVEAEGGWVRAREVLCERAGLISDPRAVVRAELVCALAFESPSGEGGVACSRTLGRLRWPPQEGHQGYGPGFLPVFTADKEAIWESGVLVHRRRCFEALEGGLRGALGLDAQ